jgi:predicted nucleic acid-binding Zn ribbon protein
LRKGWIGSLSEGLKKIAPTIKIEKNEGNGNAAHAVLRKDKPENEIAECLEKEEGKRVLGVDTRHIRREDENYDVHSPAPLKQKKMLFQRMCQRFVKHEV